MKHRQSGIDFKFKLYCYEKDDILRVGNRRTGTNGSTTIFCSTSWTRAGMETGQRT
jgi:hypothetical protein